MKFYVRTSPNADETVAAIRRLMLRLDPNLPIEGLRTMDEAMRGATTRERRWALSSATGDTTPVRGSMNHWDRDSGRSESGR